ncbi:MAG: hypothetical protein GKS00_25095 [Alphaproteobacteria bacterium]|nr:hypothetical protein [Alphaproteobacteria bacterium]
MKTESTLLLAYLYNHAKRPEFNYRFKWEKGSTSLWDNRCAQHFAINDYHGKRRSMHRVAICGDQPV